jgi:hypothetical protein
MTRSVNALATLVSPVQNIFSSPYTISNHKFKKIAQVKFTLSENGIRTFILYLSAELFGWVSLHAAQSRYNSGVRMLL